MQTTTYIKAEGGEVFEIIYTESPEIETKSTLSYINPYRRTKTYMLINIRPFKPPWKNIYLSYCMMPNNHYFSSTENPNYHNLCTFLTPPPRTNSLLRKTSTSVSNKSTHPTTYNNQSIDSQLIYALE